MTRSFKLSRMQNTMVTFTSPAWPQLRTRPSDLSHSQGIHRNPIQAREMAVPTIP